MPIDHKKIFASLPAYMGLELSFKGRKWIGGYYLDGSKSGRWDKMSCFLGKDGFIKISEQGGEVIGIWEWMSRYSGLHDKKEIYNKLSGEPMVGFPRVLPEKIKEEYKGETKYVSWGAVGHTESGSYKDNLFVYLAEKFGEQRVLSAYNKYLVGNMERYAGLATVFWVIDEQNRVLHDTWIVYGTDGHRKKEKGCTGRKYKVDYGYNGRGYFGAHLLAENRGNIFLVEAPKTAVILSCAWPVNTYLATMGNTRLGVIGENWKLLPDNDAAGRKWNEKYPDKCVDWQAYYRGLGLDVQEGEDIGDLILKQI